MENAKIALGLSRRTVDNLVAFIRDIVAAMTGNPNFMVPNPLPDPALADLGIAATDLEDAQRDKKSLGLANRDEKRMIAEGLLTLESYYVASVAKGNAAIIESSGMPLRKTNSPLGEPGQVIGVKVSDSTESAEAVVSHKGATGKPEMYYYQYTTDPALSDKSWVTLNPTGKRRLKIIGLISGRKTAFRVRAYNTAGFGNWSTVAFRIIQ
ncbi:MAG: fibronectin type III domain-containing protein [Bacteroidota bacterium]